MAIGKGDGFIFHRAPDAWPASWSRKIKLSPFPALALIVALACSTAGCGVSVCKDTWRGPGRASHFAAGFIIGAGSSTLAGHDRWNPASSAIIGLGAVAAGGVAKEAADLEVAKACWSWKDFAWVMLGGAVGTAIGTVAGAPAGR